MTGRFILLVAASLCTALAPIRPASAQTEMPLRASYQGQFLPEGTEIIILSKEGRVQRDGRFQPEFIPTGEFPRTSRSALRRDRLGNNGRSNRGYVATQESGRLYFIYALAPDSTLYWSYSAQRDSLKYDVVSTGVMSVAPVPTSEIRDDVLRSFFQSRVSVVMRGEEAPGTRTGPPGGEEADGGETGEVAGNRGDFALTAASVDSASLTTEVAPLPADADEAARDTVTAVTAPPIASATPTARSASSGVTLPPFLAWSLVFLMLIGIAVPVYFAHTYRTALKQARRDMFTLRDRMGARGDGAEPHDRIYDSDLGAEPHVDASFSIERDELRAALEDANLRYQQLEEDYDILQARYSALERELEAQRI